MLILSIPQITYRTEYNMHVCNRKLQGIYKEQLINVKKNKKKKKKKMMMMTTNIDITVSQRFSFSRTPFGFEK